MSNRYVINNFLFSVGDLKIKEYSRIIDLDSSMTRLKYYNTSIIKDIKIDLRDFTFPKFGSGRHLIKTEIFSVLDDSISHKYFRFSGKIQNVFYLMNPFIHLQPIFKNESYIWAGSSGNWIPLSKEIVTGLTVVNDKILIPGSKAYLNRF